MLQKTIHRLLRRRHFWREVGFDELSEIYVSIMLRSLAISLSGLFIPLYMLKLDHTVTEIAFLAACYFLSRAFWGDISAAYAVARFGPKHTLIVGNLLLIVSTAMFLTLPQVGWPIWFVGLVWGASASFFFVPFHIDFSKIKHKEHGGKELGYLNVMEKLGYAAGPIIGGVIATLYGPQYIFIIATIMLIVGLVPLFQTGEPVKTKQKLDWKGIDIGSMKRDFISYAGLGVENTICIFMWPLYLGLFVLVGSAAYAKLGALSSISVIASIATAYAIGKIIDNRKGRMLLRVSAIANVGTHIIRPFIKSYTVALGVNLANETITIGYRMPYIKGMYDAADDLPGYRIVYITSMEWFGSACKAVAWLLLTILSMSFSAQTVMVVGFGIAAIGSLVTMTERFKALD